jgi:hypothetical protein
MSEFFLYLLLLIIEREIAGTIRNVEREKRQRIKIN